MKPQLPAALALLAMVAFPEAARAETDFAAVGKVQCVPDKVTRYTEPGRCTTRDASASDKSQVLVIDFADKSVSMRRGEQSQPIGKVTEDKVEGGVRLIVMSEQKGAHGRTARMKLAKDGKLSIDFGGAGGSAEATCTAAS
jgi:glucose/arabinose dehydrogenase